jgi:hypothetical protein
VAQVDRAAGEQVRGADRGQGDTDRVLGERRRCVIRPAPVEPDSVASPKRRSRRPNTAGSLRLIMPGDQRDPVRGNHLGGRDACY